MRIFGLLALVLVAPLGMAAQEGAITSHSEQPQARAGDVDSVAHIVGALYGVISGGVGEKRDWERMRSLFVPGARLIPVRVVPGTPDRKTAPATDVVFYSIEDYIARSTPVMEKQGFFERGTHDEIAAFGNMVHVFSTYESRHGVGDATPFARGINSIQLLKDGGRYWIVDVLWDAERPETPIPAKYLPAGAMGAGLNSNLYGEWTGQLEYRDFQTNERTFLPTWLTMAPTADGNGVTLNYVYDDGPGKVVRESSTLRFAGDTASLGDETYKVAGLEEFRKVGRGTLVLTGSGKENGKVVDVRITVTLRRNLWTWRKETRMGGGEFLFRDGYAMTRAGVPG